MQLCGTRHGEGGQDVFAFPPVAARFVRWTCATTQPERVEIVEINLYGPPTPPRSRNPGAIARSATPRSGSRQARA